jgi:hypothetical protein
MKPSRLILLLLGSVVSVLCVAFGVVAFKVMFRGIEENYTPIRIDVVNDAAAVRLRFSYCDGRSTLPKLHLVEVVRPRNSAVGKEECLVLEENASDRPLQEWRLGAPIVGFRFQGCDHLASGEYRVSASGAGVFGSASFRLDADGAVTPTSPPCR